MNQTELENAIESALDNLQPLNEDLFVNWYSELFDENDNKIQNTWTKESLELIERDVMYQTRFKDASQ